MSVAKHAWEAAHGIGLPNLMTEFPPEAPTETDIRIVDDAGTVRDVVDPLDETTEPLCDCGARNCACPPDGYTGDCA